MWRDGVLAEDEEGGRGAGGEEGVGAELGFVELSDATDEVVGFRFSDFEGGYGAGRGQVGGFGDAGELGDVNFAVDFGGHAFEARLPHQIRFLRRALEHNAEGLAD